MRSLSRRETLLLAINTAAVAVVAAGRATATPNEAQAEIATFTGGKMAQPGRISIDLPEIAENGNAIPLSIVVDSPMTADDHVAEVLVIAENNPRPRVANFRFSSLSGRAEAVTRIRLAATQNVIVIARTSDGQLFTARKEVKVTIGGCGG